MTWNIPVTLIIPGTTNPPVTSSIVPNQGTDNTPVVIHGTNLIGATAVEFHYAPTDRLEGSVAQKNLTVSPDGTSVSFTVPAALWGFSDGSQQNVYVVSPEGKSNPQRFTLTNPGNTSNTPTITSLNPSSGGVGTAVTITGSGFTATGNTIKLGNYVGAQSVSSADGATLTFTIPASLSPYCPAGQACPMYAMLTRPGTYQVSVTNVDGPSNQVPFVVTGSGISYGPTPTPVSTPPSVQTLEQELQQLISLLLQLLQQAAAKGLLNSGQLNSAMHSISQ